MIEKCQVTIIIDYAIQAEESNNSINKYKELLNEKFKISLGEMIQKENSIVESGIRLAEVDKKIPMNVLNEIEYLNGYKRTELMKVFETMVIKNFIILFPDKFGNMPQGSLRVILDLEMKNTLEEMISEILEEIKKSPPEPLVKYADHIDAKLVRRVLQEYGIVTFSYQSIILNMWKITQFVIQNPIE